MIISILFAITADWVTAVGTCIGATGAIVAFITLFRKDKLKSSQLDRLTTIAENHLKIAREMQIQSKEMQTQSAEMQKQTYFIGEANKIMEQQLKIQQMTFLADQENAEQNRIRTEEQDQLMRQQHKTEIQPYFRWIGNGSSPDGRIHIDLKNLGRGEARDIELQPIDGSARLTSIHPKNANTNTDVIINLESRSQPAHSATARFQIIFHDIEGNRYYQQIEKSSNNRITVSDPFEILA